MSENARNNVPFDASKLIKDIVFSTQVMFNIHYYNSYTI